jgi:hypothetical protein
MTRIRAVVLVSIGAVTAVTLLVPPARDELSWFWAEFQDRAPNYMAYVNDWPKGLHANEAKLLYEKREWDVTKRALITQAYQQTSRTNGAPDADAAYRSERLKRRELLSWRQATSANTLDGYKDYLRQYPRGRFAGKAHAQVETIILSTRGAEPLNNTVPH